MDHRNQAIARVGAGAIRASYWLGLFLITALALLNRAHADQLSLIINGKAVHLGAGSTVYNEKNWGGGLQYDFAKSENNWVPFITGSGFRDSNGNPSYYAGGGAAKRFEFDNGDYHADVGAIAFVMTRKEFRNGDPFLGVLPVLSFGSNRVSVNATYVPKMDPKWVPLWFFQLKIGFY